MQDHLGRGPDDLWIDIGPRAFDRIKFEHHDPKRDADMRRGDPDSGRGVHGLQQVAGEVAQRAVEHGHRLRRERKARIGVADNGADGHDGEVTVSVAPCTSVRRSKMRHLVRIRLHKARTGRRARDIVTTSGKFR
jgi:hypothetical protein